MEPTEVAVLVVDDDPFVRSAVRQLLESGEGVCFAGEAEDGFAVESLVRQIRPDVVLMDMQMPRMSGPAAIRRVAALADAPAVIALTNHVDDAHIVEALRSGAVGYLVKNSSPAQICQAAISAAAGDYVISPEIVRRLAVTFAKGAGAPPSANRLSWLTEREQEVARAVAAGQSNQQIARRLNMSLSTVKTNVSRILTKLNLPNRVHIALLVHGIEGHD